MFGRDQKPAIVLLLRVEEVHVDMLEDVLPGSEQELDPALAIVHRLQP